MTLNITLDTDSINRAISRLIDAQDYLELGVETLIDILVHDGADVAQSMYGGMATVSAEANGTEGTISASGKAVGIAEFGAGDTVMPVMFENSPGFPVYSGSYSESPEGSGEYAATGRWHFGGRTYTAIEPRMGLLIAKEQIIGTMVDIAQEVIQI